MTLFAFLALGVATIAGSVKIGDMEQGAEFTKCISNADLETKTLDDDITLIERVDGCCPAGSVPGVKFFASYSGAQIVCGMKDDGTVALSTGSSNGVKTCTYNKCYVMKQNIPCKDGIKQRLNGCCGAKPQTNFDAQCKFYDKSFNNAHSEKVNYCTTYDKDYGSKGRAGTSAKTDDVAGGKLQVDKLYTYTPCPGNLVGGGGSSATSGTAATGSATNTGGTATTTGAATTKKATSMAASLWAPSVTSLLAAVFAVAWF
jgi:hypothetical protein